jgi:hypothetical protein
MKITYITSEIVAVRLYLVVFLLLAGLTLNAQRRQPKRRRPNYPGLNGHSIQAIPAVFWRTMALSGEYTVSPAFAVGVYGAYYFGEPIKETTKVAQAYHSPGFDAGLYAKYFWTGYAPEGFHSSLGVHYNTIVYSSGNIKPYALHKYWIDNTPIDINDRIVLPNSIHVTLNTGYQVVVIPNNVIGNIELGTAHGFGSNGYRLSIFIQPSLGFVF